jgi:hypothetical protein
VTAVKPQRKGANPLSNEPFPCPYFLPRTSQIYIPLATDHLLISRTLLPMSQCATEANKLYRSKSRRRQHSSRTQEITRRLHLLVPDGLTDRRLLSILSLADKVTHQFSERPKGPNGLISNVLTQHLYSDMQTFLNPIEFDLIILLKHTIL